MYKKMTVIDDLTVKHLRAILMGYNKSVRKATYPSLWTASKAHLKDLVVTNFLITNAKTKKGEPSGKHKYTHKGKRFTIAL
jgi:hypothetical protein